MSTFDNVSDKYGRFSLVQAAAAEKLITLLQINDADDILDVGCGPGNITNILRTLTKGRVEGTDISPGMISQAKEKYPDIRFKVMDASALPYKSEFDLLFCNSTFQWFKDPTKPLNAMFKALRPGGKIGIACPGTKRWSGCFIDVAEEAGKQRNTKETFRHWHSPWIWLENEDAYRTLFTDHGFEIIHLKIEKEISTYSPEQAFSNFISGAAQGYTGKAFYDIEVLNEYIDQFKKNAEKAMLARQKDGKVEVDFNRLYFIGRKK